MKVTIVAGARPNFMKIAPLIKSIQLVNKKGIDITYRLIHTGQHFDKKMSQIFFDQLNIPKPDVNFSCGGGTQAEQTASIMILFEQELLKNPTDVVIVVGDVTSTMACAITAKKLNIQVVHVEAGIRSGDHNMPEEINRIVTDSISDFFFTTSETATKNLLKQDISRNRIFFVGNTMIDTLFDNLKNFKRPSFMDKYQIRSKKYILLTLHRPSNVDNESKLEKIILSIINASNDTTIVFPAHPRTIKNLKKLKFKNNSLIIVEPQPYFEFLYLLKHSLCMITDSGGITEEATVLHIPCLTMRDSTERPETIKIGTNRLIGEDYNQLNDSLKKIIRNNWKKGKIPKYWDGHTSKRIVNTLYNLYG